ncbi:MAG: hypothetical protein O9310_09730 [Leptospiraceae bacterium]|nr:hypothetical protein [Leptospiraceae bacterium]
MSKEIEKFKELCIQYGHALNSGNNRISNKLHTKLMQFKNSLDLSDLNDISDTDDDSIKLWVAVFILEYNEEKGLHILNLISKRGDLIGLTANSLIDMWDKKMI